MAVCAKCSAPLTAAELAAGVCSLCAAPPPPRFATRPQAAATVVRKPSAEQSSSAAAVVGGDQDTWFGQYRIVERVGRGGMGDVFKAEQANPHRLVALKVLPRARLRPAHDRQRFRREADAVARISHPYIVPIYECGETNDGTLFYSMELIDGEPLDASRSAELRERLALIIKVCEGVQAAHHKGVIHRDLKPANILVDRDGNPRILDFGIAKISVPEGDAAIELSRDGLIMGTPRYMAPEQTLGRSDQIDTRSDVYALGVMLYELVTGTMPYDTSGSVVEVLLRIRNVEPVRPRTRESSIPVDLEAVILRALEKDPGRRYQSTGELAEDLQHFLDNETVRARVPTTTYRLTRWVQRNRAVAATAVGSTVLLLVIAVVAFVRVNAARRLAEVHRADAERERLHAEVQARHAQAAAEEAGRQLQSHLSSLLLSQFRDRNYEAAAATATQLSSQFGVDALRDAALRDAARVAIHQNNLNKLWQLPVSDPQAVLPPLDIAGGWLIPIVGDGRLWFWDPRNGRAVRSVSLPGAEFQRTNIAVGPRGTVFYAAGTTLYSLAPDAADFLALIDLATADIPALPWRAADATARQWMQTAGRHYAITGLAIDGSATTAAVVLGDAVVCHLDLTGRCYRSWWFGRTSADDPAAAAAFRRQPMAGETPSLTAISLDGRWTACRLANRRLLILANDPLQLRYTGHNSGYTIKALAFTPDSTRLQVVGAQGELTIIGLPEEKAAGVDLARPRQLPLPRIEHATFDRTSTRLCCLANDGSMLVLPTTTAVESKRVRRLAPVPWVDIALDSERGVLCLTADGQLRGYDDRAFDVRRCSLPTPLTEVWPGADAGCVLATAAGDGALQLLELRLPTATTDLRLTVIREFREPAPPLVMPDRRGRLAVVAWPDRTEVYDLAGRSTLREIPVTGLTGGRFSDDGERFGYLDRDGIFRVLRTDQWTEIGQSGADFKHWLRDRALVSAPAAGARLLLAGDDPRPVLECRELPGDEVRWRVPLRGGTPSQLVRWQSPLWGDSYWVRFHYGQFSCYAAASGRPIVETGTWWKQQPRHVVLSQASGLAAFPTQTGNLQICSADSLQPIFDAAIFDAPAGILVFAADGSELVVVSGRSLYLVETGRWRQNSILTETLAAVLGSAADAYGCRQQLLARLKAAAAGSDPGSDSYCSAGGRQFFAAGSPWPTCSLHGTATAAVAEAQDSLAEALAAAASDGRETASYRQAAAQLERVLPTRCTATVANTAYVWATLREPLADAALILARRAVSDCGRAPLFLASLAQAQLAVGDAGVAVALFGELNRSSEEGLPGLLAALAARGEAGDEQAACQAVLDHLALGRSPDLAAAAVAALAEAPATFSPATIQRLRDSLRREP